MKHLAQCINEPAIDENKVNSVIFLTSKELNGIILVQSV